jgi:hypothetical protein
MFETDNDAWSYLRIVIELNLKNSHSLWRYVLGYSSIYKLSMVKVEA